MKFTLANIVSISRAIIAPIFFVLIISDDPVLVVSGCILFIIGASTDYIDGWLARKFHEVTSFGNFLDPLADKVLTSSAFIAFAVLGIVELWMVLLIIIRDIGTTLMRLYADSVSKPMKTSQFAKVKTFLQMFFISYILVLLFLKNFYQSQEFLDYIETLIFSPICYYIMLALTLITLWTAFEYIMNNYSAFKLIFSKKENTNEEKNNAR